MTHTYEITGLTCGGCIAKAKSELLKLGDVTDADLQLAAPQATISMQKHIPTEALQAALSRAGDFTIRAADGGMHHHAKAVATGEQGSWWLTYKPILLVGAYLTGTTLLIEVVQGFDAMRWMQHFMAAFFLVFSFFKLLDLKGFAQSYSSYDVVAKRWMGWGFIYPFVELFLGLAFLTNFAPLFINGATFVVMGTGMIGVAQSIMAKRKIQCACLGTVFNVPMSTITLIEDVLMMAMSAYMIIHLLN